MAVESLCSEIDSYLVTKSNDADYFQPSFSDLLWQELNGTWSVSDSFYPSALSSKLKNRDFVDIAANMLDKEYQPLQASDIHTIANQIALFIVDLDASEYHGDPVINSIRRVLGETLLPLLGQSVAIKHLLMPSLLTKELQDSLLAGFLRLAVNGDNELASTVWGIAVDLGLVAIGLSHPTVGAIASSARALRPSTISNILREADRN